MNIQQQNQAFQERNRDQYFQAMSNKLTELSTKAKNIQQPKSDLSYFIKLQKDINRQLENLADLKKNAKIYIVILGTISSGKSTFINALLGQKLLSSSNQACTTQVTYIGHQNTNANQETFITINGQQFDSTDKASKSLTSIRTDENVKIVEIKTQNQELNLKNCEPKKYFQQVDKINKQIKQDEKSLRIYVYVNDYTTFERENIILQGILSQVICSKEQILQQIKNPDLKKIQQTEKVSQLFFIINKFDQRKKTEDKSIEIIKQDINEVFQTQNIYMISASKALGYNIMNYGTEKDITNFIKQYYEDYKESENLLNQEEARQCCVKKIKTNPNLIEKQDFGQFISTIQERISLILIQKFNGLTDDLNQKIASYDLMSKLLEEKRIITKQRKNKIHEILQTYKSKLLNEYHQKQIKFFQEIDEFMQKIRKTIEVNSHQEQFKQCGIYTLFLLNQLKLDFDNIAFQRNQQLFDQLTLVFENKEQIVSLRKYWELILNSFMKENVQNMDLQFLQTQEQNSHQIQGISEILGVGAFDINLNGAGAGARLAGVAGVAGVGVAGLFYLGYKTYEHYALLPSLRQKLDDWQSSLIKQSQTLIKNYNKNCDKQVEFINDLNQ